MCSEEFIRILFEYYAFQKQVVRSFYLHVEETTVLWRGYVHVVQMPSAQISSLRSLPVSFSSFFIPGFHFWTHYVCTNDFWCFRSVEVPLDCAPTKDPFQTILLSFVYDIAFIFWDVTFLYCILLPSYAKWFVSEFV